MRVLLPLFLVTSGLNPSFTVAGQSIRRLRNVIEVEDQPDVEGKAVGREDILFYDEVDFFFRHLEASMSMSMPPSDECVSSFSILKFVVESSKGATAPSSIVLCPGVIKFDSLIEMSDARFEMKCESSRSEACVLDGQGKGPLFEAGKFRQGVVFSRHTASFENIVFVNGNNTHLIGGGQRQGGALSFVGGDVTLKECTFRDNTAQAGGALFVEAGKAVIDNCVFEDNISNSRGGAIVMGGCGYLDAILDIVIRYTKFQNNTALSRRNNGKDIFQDCPQNDLVDCGEGSGNQFCDAEPGKPTAIGFAEGAFDLCPGAEIDC